MLAVSKDKIGDISNGLDGIARVFVRTQENSPEKEIANSLVVLLESCGKKHANFKTFNQVVLEEALKELTVEKEAINLAIKKVGFYRSKKFAAFLSQILTKGKHSKARYKAILKLFACFDLQRMVNSLVLVADFVYNNFDLPVAAELVIEGAILVYNGEDIKHVACKIGKAHYLKQESLANIKVKLASGQTYDQYLEAGLAKSYAREKIKSIMLCYVMLYILAYLVFLFLCLIKLYKIKGPHLWGLFY